MAGYRLRPPIETWKGGMDRDWVARQLYILIDVIWTKLIIYLINNIFIYSKAKVVSLAITNHAMIYCGVIVYKYKKTKEDQCDIAGIDPLLII